MNSQHLEQLYHDTILSHNRSPRNFGKLTDYSHTTIGRNPLCGDSYQLFVRIAGGAIAEISFYGEGCAISKASCSIMSEQVKGQSLEQAAALKDDFLAMLLSEDAAVQGQSELPSDLPRKLQLFQGLWEYPMRVKCATLIWRALEAVLGGEEGAVSTESG